MADEQPRGKPAVLDLDEHVDQLLEQMDTECARLESNSPAPIGKDTPDDPPPADPEPEAEEPTPEPAAEPPASAAEAPADPEPGTPTELDADLDAKVGEMIAEAERAEAAEDAPTPEAPPPLDAGENDAADGEVDSTDTNADGADSCLADLTSQLLSGEMDLDDESAFAPAGAGTEPDGAPAAASAPAPEIKPKAPGPLRVLADRGRRVAGRVWGVALPAGATGVMKINAPLESRDPTVRQTVGWMALYTGFLALCVWGYLLLIRSPETPPAETVPAAMVGENAASDQGPGASAESMDSIGSASVDRQD